MKSLSPFYIMLALFLSFLLEPLGGWLSASHADAQEADVRSNFQRENLIAWCIVPFDAEKRTPQQRASMLAELGLKHLAYDWREEHVATWDEELDALKAQDIELTAFWCQSSLHPAETDFNQLIIDFLTRRQHTCQLWLMLPDGQLTQIQDEQKRIAVAAEAVRELAERVAPLGCDVGLYNHGGWIGRPRVLVRVMESLSDLENIGLVYNFHHAHEDLGDFPEALARMKPYLLCLNLNGMSPGGPKIQPIGTGKFDAEIIRWILQVGYTGPIGILDHRPELDARQSLQENLHGLAGLLQD